MGVKKLLKILMVRVLPKPTNPMIPVRRNQKKWRSSQGTEDLVRDHANVTVLAHADLATGRVREHADLHATGHAETDLETEDDDLGQETDADPDQGNGKDQDIRSG